MVVLDRQEGLCKSMFESDIRNSDYEYRWKLGLKKKGFRTLRFLTMDECSRPGRSKNSEGVGVGPRTREGQI